MAHRSRFRGAEGPEAAGRRTLQALGRDIEDGRMTRLLDLSREVAGDPSVARRRFAGDPAAWLPTPARWRGERAWIVSLEAGPVARNVVCRIGPPWTIGSERWRSVTWQPVPAHDDLLPVDRGLPSLVGELGLVSDGDDTRLVLRAAYQPPAGRLGAAFDAAALGQVAKRTAGRFLEHVATALASNDVMVDATR